MGMSATTESRAASGEQAGGLLRATLHALTPGRMALLLLALAAIYRLILLARGWPALDSDEAVIGLMARHILHGERPTFFWGQNYMGPFEAYFAALLFALFGSSTFMLGLSALLLTLGFLATVYWLGRAAYGPAVGLLALAWLVISPPIFTLRQLAPIGGYQEMLLLGGLILLGVWSRLRLPYARPMSRAGWLRCVAFYAALGLLAGLGFWSDMLIAPVLLVAAGALLIGRWRELLSLAGVALVVGMLVGAWPYISFNLATGNATYKQLSHQSNPSGVLLQSTGALTVGLPVVAGSPHVCVTQGNIWDPYPPAMASSTAGNDLACQAPNVLISLGALALLGVVAWQLGRWLWLWLRLAPQLTVVRDWLARRGMRIPSAGEGEAARLASVSDAEANARRWLRAMLLGIALMTLALFFTSRDAANFQFTSARYLLPLYLATPLFVGVLWEAARPVFVRLWNTFRMQSAQADFVAAGHRGAVSTARASWRRVVVPAIAALGLLWLLASSLYGGAQTLTYSGDATRFAQPIVPVDRPIIAFFDAHQVTAYYTNDYWACYRVVFEVNERIHCAIRGETGQPNLTLNANRYQPWVDELARAAHPAYLLTLGSVQDQQFTQLAAAAGLPHEGYTRTVVGGYAVYFYTGT
jgi:4-amino-4-deoxy-L-arabinose transferase-like glycosyltransferase